MKTVLLRKRQTTDTSVVCRFDISAMPEHRHFRLTAETDADIILNGVKTERTLPAFSVIADDALNVGSNVMEVFGDLGEAFITIFDIAEITETETVITSDGVDRILSVTAAIRSYEKEKAELSLTLYNKERVTATAVKKFTLNGGTQNKELSLTGLRPKQGKTYRLELVLSAAGKEIYSKRLYADFTG